jgi:hypothetical protein
MKWFGPDWGASVCRTTPQVLTPSGNCTNCGEPIEQGNQGFVMPHVVLDGVDLSTIKEGSLMRVEERPVHLECLLLHVGAIIEVHILQHGYALCNLEGVPADWPEGHRWVRIEEKKRATCRACLRKAGDIT